MQTSLQTGRILLTPQAPARRPEQLLGVVHVQQYASFIKDVPTIGVLFLLNGFGAGVICVMLATRVRLLGALAGIGLCVGALISIAVARYGSTGLFAYREPTIRTPVAIAVIAEIAALLVLGTLALRGRAPSRNRRDATLSRGGA